MSSSASLNPEAPQHFTMAASRFIFICLCLWGVFMAVFELDLHLHFFLWAFSAASLFVFRRLILKWSRSVVHVQLRSNRALALAKFLRSKRLKVETNFTDALKRSVICAAVRRSNLSLLSGCLFATLLCSFLWKKKEKGKHLIVFNPQKLK